jgi:hypothetical protein
VNQITAQRVNEEIPRRGPGHNHPHIVEHQPLYGGDVLGGDRGEIRSDLEAGRVGIGPTEDEDKEPVGDGEGVGVERAEKVGVVHQPSLLPGANLAQLLARNAPQLGRVAPPPHNLLFPSFFFSLFSTSNQTTPNLLQFPRDIYWIQLVAQAREEKNTLRATRKEGEGLLRACLANNSHSYSIFFISFKKNRKSNKKYFLFFTFYITSIIFYYYLNKKIHCKQNFFTFLQNNSKFFYNLYHNNYFFTTF